MADEGNIESGDTAVKETSETVEKTSPSMVENVNDDKPAENGTSKETDPEIVKKEATMLFLQGKRHLIIRDYQLAVEALAEACQLFGKIYSEHANEMADPYFYYGKALFEIARNESDVLGDQVAKDEEKNDEDDEIPEEEEMEKGDKNDEEEKNESDETPENNGEANGSQEVPEETDSEAVNDLQLSWEYLELAKLIYSRKADTCKDTAIKLAEVYMLLGENGLESESYATAIEDMKEGLALLQKNLPPEDRRIAEMCYHLGMAYSISENFDEAINHFQNAITHLQQKIDSLQKRIETGDKKTESEERDAFYTMEGEVDEIKGLINEIKEKITDMNDYKRQVKEELVKQVLSGGCSAGASSSSNPSTSGAGSSSSSSSAADRPKATDISHLIRKKRKNEDEESNAEKKTKVEEKADE